MSDEISVLNGDPGGLFRSGPQPATDATVATRATAATRARATTVATTAPAETTGQTAATYEDLFRQQFRPMVGLAGLLGADDPENVAQDAFVRLHSRGRLLRDPNAARAYLRVTVVNLTRSGHRHLSVVRRNPSSAPIPPRGVEDTVLASVGNAAVLDALRLLSPRHREALVLRYWADLTEREMAVAMKVSIGTVKSHVSRGLVALAAAIARLEGPS